MTQGSVGRGGRSDGRWAARLHPPRTSRHPADPTAGGSIATPTEAHVDDVETARGAVEIDQLGHVLMHEHVFTLDVEFTQNYPEQWEGDEQRVDEAVAKLDALKRSGIDTIVDLTV